jgi:hypothetical protein
MTSRPYVYVGALLLVALCVGSCSGSGSTATPAPSAIDEGTVDLVQILSGEYVPKDWLPDGETEVYDEETLFDLVNGQADAFYAYNFRQVAVQRYKGHEGDTLRVEVWELATSGDAYGLFTRNAAGTTPAVPVGNEADADPGLRLAFWQDRYFVQVRTYQHLPETSIAAVAAAIAGALPEGGVQPALIRALPAEDRTHERAIYFRHEISIQDEIWLGGENVLGLGQETAGVLARYEIAGTPAHLLLVQYPAPVEAAAALERLREGDVADLAAAEVQDTVLTALFGGVDPDTARAWLEALSAADL